MAKTKKGSDETPAATPPPVEVTADPTGALHKLGAQVVDRAVAKCDPETRALLIKHAAQAEPVVYGDGAVVVTFRWFEGPAHEVPESVHDVRLDNDELTGLG